MVQQITSRVTINGTDFSRHVSQINCTQIAQGEYPSATVSISNPLGIYTADPDTSPLYMRSSVKIEVSKDGGNTFHTLLDGVITEPTSTVDDKGKATITIQCMGGKNLDKMDINPNCVSSGPFKKISELFKGTPTLQNSTNTWDADSEGIYPNGLLYKTGYGYEGIEKLFSVSFDVPSTFTPTTTRIYDVIKSVCDTYGLVFFIDDANSKIVVRQSPTVAPFPPYSAFTLQRGKNISVVNDNSDQRHKFNKVLVVGSSVHAVVGSGNRTYVHKDEGINDYITAKKVAENLYSIHVQGVEGPEWHETTIQTLPVTDEIVGKSILVNDSYYAQSDDVSRNVVSLSHSITGDRWASKVRLENHRVDSGITLAEVLAKDRKDDIMSGKAYLTSNDFEINSTVSDIYSHPAGIIFNDTTNGTRKVKPLSNAITVPVPEYISFDGVDDYITSSNLDFINPTGTYTVEMLIWYDGAVAGTDYQTLMLNGTGASDRNGINIKSDGTLGFQSYDGADYDGLVDTGFPPNEWVHITAVCDAGTKTLYVDGVSVGTSGNNYQITPSNAFWFSHDTVSTNNTGPFKGDLKYIRVWDDVRTSTEINEYKDILTMPPESSLYLQWCATDVSGTVVADSANNDDSAFLRIDTDAESGELTDTITLDGDFTVVAELRANATSAGTGGGSHNMYMGDFDTGNSFLSLQGGNQLYARFSGSDYTWTIDNYVGSIAAYELIRNGSTVTLWVDGVNKGTNTITENFVISEIGGVPSTAYWFDGDLFEVSISTDTTSHKWVFDGGSGTTVSDSGTGSNDLTFTSTDWYHPDGDITGALLWTYDIAYSIDQLSTSDGVTQLDNIEYIFNDADTLGKTFSDAHTFEVNLSPSARTVETDDVNNKWLLLGTIPENYPIEVESCFAEGYTPYGVPDPVSHPYLYQSFTPSDANIVGKYSTTIDMSTTTVNDVLPNPDDISSTGWETDVFTDGDMQSISSFGKNNIFVDGISDSTNTPFTCVFFEFDTGYTKEINQNIRDLILTVMTDNPYDVIFFLYSPFYSGWSSTDQNLSTFNGYTELDNGGYYFSNGILDPTDVNNIYMSDDGKIRFGFAIRGSSDGDSSSFNIEYAGLSAKYDVSNLIQTDVFSIIEPVEFKITKVEYPNLLVTANPLTIQGNLSIKPTSIDGIYVDATWDSTNEIYTDPTNPPEYDGPVAWSETSDGGILITVVNYLRPQFGDTAIPQLGDTKVFYVKYRVSISKRLGLPESQSWSPSQTLLKQNISDNSKFDLYIKLIPISPVHGTSLFVRYNYIGGAAGAKSIPSNTGRIDEGIDMGPNKSLSIVTTYDRTATSATPDTGTIGGAGCDVP